MVMIKVGLYGGSRLKFIGMLWLEGVGDWLGRGFSGIDFFLVFV